jgi:hypothetical protein
MRFSGWIKTVTGTTSMENFSIKRLSITFIPQSKKKKIIDYFHSAIEKDKNGYYLCQERDSFREKVYFPHEDSVLFVFNVIEADDIILELNTKRRVKLKPRKLFIKEDSLYMAEKDEIIKFAEHALMRISKLLEYENDRYFIRVKARRYAIKNVAASQPV